MFVAVVILTVSPHSLFNIYFAGFMIPNNRQADSSLVYIIFSIWTFILLCRPQDYLSFLEILRPGFTFGLLTLLVFFFSANKGEQISDSKQFRLFRYLIIVMIIGIPFSYYRSASLKDVFDYASVAMMFFYLFYKLVNEIDKLHNLMFAYCVGVAIYSVYVLKSGDFSGDRITFGSMFDPNDIAFFIISFLTFNLIFLSKDNKTHTKFIAAINILIGLIVILKTGSRGGLIATISVIAYLMFVKTTTVKLSFTIKATALIIAAIVALQFIEINSERYKTILTLKNDYNVTGEEGRIAIWETGLKLMLSHPLTGVGMNRFSEGIGRDREERGLGSAKWQAPHNSIVQIGTETGIFGLILFCLMSSNVFKITGLVINKSRSEVLIKTSEMVRAGFIGHFISTMFLSQAYSVYWVFYLILSSVLNRLYNSELLIRKAPEPLVTD